MKVLALFVVGNQLTASAVALGVTVASLIWLATIYDVHPRDSTIIR